MRAKAILSVVLAGSAAMLPARAHTPEQIALERLRAACVLAAIPDATCAQGEQAISGVFAGLKRAGGGVSYGDVRDQNHHGSIEVEVGSFYFAPRVLEVDLGSVVTWRNTDPAGGNRHIVSSSDWLGSDPALPAPGFSFGGGTGFSSGLMQPGDTWNLVLATRDDWPQSIVPLGISKVLIPYHCNVHGASQMSGFLLLRTDEY